MLTASTTKPSEPQTTAAPPTRRAIRARLDAARRHLRALHHDLARVQPNDADRASNLRVLLTDSSLWALALLRGSAALRALSGRSFGLSTLLRVVFHIDVWTDDIGPGLRLPHPFCIVLGEGASIGANCTLMHNVTVQRGHGTVLRDGVVVGTQVVVLAGASVGARALIGAGSVVRGAVPAHAVAVGSPARVVRQTHEGEV